MAKVSRSVLKSFFEAGDKPTQSQFASMIDSLLHYSEDRYLLGLKEYDAAEVYLIGDSVVYNLAIYVANAQTTGTFNPAVWKKIAGAVPGALQYKGTWDADLNDPDLLTVTVQAGDYYIVSVAGNTDLDGISVWDVGDMAIHNGNLWEKIENTDLVSDADNVAGNGVGVFKAKNGTMLEFRKIQTNDGSLYALLDGTNSFINLGINFNDAVFSSSNAWSSQKIKQELDAKANIVNGATINNLAALDATGNLIDSGSSSASFLPFNTVAGGIPYTPSGNITATNVQQAVKEVDDYATLINNSFQTHATDFNNPHLVNKTQLGLGAVTDDQQLALKFTAFNEAVDSTDDNPKTALTFNFTPLVAGDYFIEWYFELARSGSVVTTGTGWVTLNGNEIGLTSPRFPTEDDYVSFSGFQLANLSTVQQTVNVEFVRTAGSSGLTLIRRVRVKVVKA